jgi:aspartate racemase
MKMLGIVGGTGPESTIEYYRALIAKYRERVTDGTYPRMLISSVDVKSVLGLVATNELPRLAELLADEVSRLARGGAEVALFAANTPHIVFDEVRRLSPIPLISIIEETRDVAKQRGIRTAGLLGTRFTMTGSFYRDVFEPAGITLVVPNQEEQRFVHDSYMNELIGGNVVAKTKAELLRIIARMRERSAIEAIILGGTELSLILREDDYDGVAVLDTTKIHVDAAIREMLA